MIHRTFRMDQGAQRTARPVLGKGRPAEEDKAPVPATSGDTLPPRPATTPGSEAVSCPGEFGFKPHNNLREDSSDRLSRREPVLQTYQNPFYTNTNYLDDIDTQERFLKPCNSSFQG